MGEGRDGGFLKPSKVRHEIRERKFSPEFLEASKTTTQYSTITFSQFHWVWSVHFTKVQFALEHLCCKFVCCANFSSSRLGLCYSVIFVGGCALPSKGAFPPLSYFPISLNDDHGNEHRIRMNITEVQYHRGGLLSCALSSPTPPPPILPPATRNPLTRHAFQRS